MWRKKKFVVALVLAAVAVASIGGVVLAQSGDGDENLPQARHAALLERVCTIYEAKTGSTIDQQALQDAFVQAREDIGTEIMQDRLQSLVDEGKISQEEADERMEWLESRPDGMHGFGFKGHGRGGWGGPCVRAE